MAKRRLQSLWLFLVLLFLYAPILLLAVYSFTDAAMIGSIRSFSLHNYVSLFTMEELRDMILGTLVLTLAVAVISTLLGTLRAVGAFYAGGKKKRVMDLFNQIPVVNADVVTGFSVCVLMIVLLEVDKSTYLPLVVGLSCLSTPFVYLSVLPRLKQMDPGLYEAALDLGCTPADALRKVVFPQIAPGVISGFLLSVTLTLDDYFITTYTKPAAFDTISTYVVNATKGAQTQVKTALWALSTVIFLVAVLAVVLMNRTRTSEKTSGGRREEGR